VLKEWLDLWRKQHGIAGDLTVSLRPHSAGSTLLELAVLDATGKKNANVIFEPIHDRQGHAILSIRDQNTFAEDLRRKRLMTLAQLFLMQRYKTDSVHYLTPTDDNHKQAEAMEKRGLFSSVNDEVGQIIVAEVNKARVAELLDADRVALGNLIAEVLANTPWAAPPAEPLTDWWRGAVGGQGKRRLVSPLVYSGS
jgi:isocitrate lyase